MIASLVVHALAVGAAASLAALGAERVARAWNRPTRWVWLAAFLATALVPVLARLLPGVGALGGAAASPLRSYVLATWRVTATATPGRTMEGAFAVLWAAASLLLLARLAVGVWLLRRAARTWPPADVAGRRVLVSSGTGPAVAGLWGPRIILPRWVTELEPAARALVVRHEHEHCVARDTVPIHVSALLCALLPWNPALWWQSRRLRLAVEMDCDARVLRADHPVEDYGRLLLTIAVRRGTSVLSPAPTLTEPISYLERRIDAMTNIPARRPSTIVLTTAATVLAVVVSCAGPAATDAPREKATVTARAQVTPTRINGPYFEFQVEKAVAAASNSAGPRYPDELREAKVEGEVLAQFVVDTSGRAEVASLKVLRSPHALFTQAVRSALPDMRFVPAEVGGRKVRQLVQIPFAFTLSK